MRNSSPDNTVKINHRRLKNYCIKILVQAGLHYEQAQIVSDSLVKANLWGIDTHGVMRLPVYVKRTKKGLISTDPSMKLKMKSSSVGIVDGDNAPGQVAAKKAIEETMNLAKDTGAGFIGVNNSNHFGAAGYFTRYPLKEDMIGIAITNSEVGMVPFGGEKPCLGTNPISIAIPSSKEYPIVLDMATSIVSMGRVILAAQDGSEIPDSWAIDDNGEPTVDPNNAEAVRPIAGPKGSGLAIVFDILSGVLTGAKFGKDVNSAYHNFSEPQGVGHFMGSLNLEDFLGIDRFLSRIKRFLNVIKRTPARGGVDEVLLPGEIEFRTKKSRIENGIPLRGEVYLNLKDLGQEFGIDFL